MRDSGWQGRAAIQGGMSHQPSISCRVCGMRSFHPKDVEEGYCGRCHEYTALMSEDELAVAIRKLHRQYRTAWTDEYDTCGYCNTLKGWPELQRWPCPFIESLELGEIR